MTTSNPIVRFDSGLNQWPLPHVFLDSASHRAIFIIASDLLHIQEVSHEQAQALRETDVLATDNFFYEGHHW